MVGGDKTGAVAAPLQTKVHMAAQSRGRAQVLLWRLDSAHFCHLQLVPFNANKLPFENASLPQLF